MAERNPPALEHTDVIGDQGRAAALYELVADLQGQRFRLEAMKIANGSEDADPCGRFTSDGAPVSYADRDAQLREAEVRLRTAYESVWPALEQLLAARAQN